MHIRGGAVLPLIFTASLLASGFVTSPVSAAVLAASTFDSGTEGWTAIRVDTAGNALPGTVSVAAGAGHPGGALRHDAPSDSRTSYFEAPSSFVGALRSAVGGSISWDFATIKSTDDIFFPPPGSDPDIDIRAGTNHIRRNVVTAATAPISPTYLRNSLTFGTDAEWVFFNGANTSPATQAQIDSVLAGAESLRIRAEYWSSFTPDTTFLDNVIIAGPGVGVALDRSTVAPGDVVDMRLFAIPPQGPVDLYVVVALPLSLAPTLGCGNSLPLVFLTNAGFGLTLACLSNPPNTFPRFLSGTTLSNTTLLSLVWPGGAPSGAYTFAVVATPPGALADGVLGPTDIVGLASAQLTVP
jgi:Laminin B (Domain IV)